MPEDSAPDIRQPADPPWIFRTYAGHSTAEKSNALYRANLARGQTGLSIAFDLPTQTGYDSDHILARGEVGKVGTPVSHLGDMRTLFDGIPLDRMNTSMTINAPAAWLLALYVALADEQQASRRDLQGTTQNDILKEYLSRGTYVFPPAPSMRLTADTIAWALVETPKWNAMNVCSYHLQEAGATPEQELAYALANAIAVLDELRNRDAVRDFDAVFGRISFFVNAGMRFVTEMCKMRAFGELWEEIGRARYGVTSEKALRFRYGVQVNSLGLTEPQAENNVYRILLEMLAVTLSKSARARAVQLPAWNEALGLPRPWDQQWSLRMQQILAYETDLLEHDDLFDGSPVVAARVASLKDGARRELALIEEAGGAMAAVALMKAALVESNRRRVMNIEAERQIVVGVNRWTDSESSPLGAGEGAIQLVDPRVEQEQVARLRAWRAGRDATPVRDALQELTAAAREDRNIMPASIACAKAGVTTGEWGDALRQVFGEYRAPTGVALIVTTEEDAALDELRCEVSAVSARLGRTLTFLVGKPGLDGHSNGAEQIATRGRAAGMSVVYDGIRLTPAEIAVSARENRVHVVGLSILSGSHLDLVQETIRLLRAEGLHDVPVVVGGIVPPEDALVLRQMGVSRIYTPKDYRITDIMGDLVRLVSDRAQALAQI